MNKKFGGEIFCSVQINDNFCVLAAGGGKKKKDLGVEIPIWRGFEFPRRDEKRDKNGPRATVGLCRKNYVSIYKFNVDILGFVSQGTNAMIYINNFIYFSIKIRDLHNTIY